MATSHTRKPQQRRSGSSHFPQQASAQQPVASPLWILKAIGLVILASVFCGYLTLCWLYNRGQWQLVLQPAAAITLTPASTSLQFDDVHFDDTEAGQPQLSGWYIPSAASSRFSGLTVLYLHDGRGSLSDTLPRLRMLHDLGTNVFAIDYRGFGRSADVHPSEQRMYDDADAAWNYLTGTRKVSASHIVLYGDRLGAAVAAEAAVRHPQAAAVVLMAPFATMLPHVLTDSRSNLVPVHLLFHNRFDLAARIGQVKQPKLIGFSGDEVCPRNPQQKDSPEPCPTAAEAQQLYQNAGYPKQLFNASGKIIPETAYAEFLSRFLDEYGSTAASQLAVDSR